MRWSGFPPVTRLALVFAGAAALSRPGVPRSLTPLLLILLALPIRISRRPAARLAWVAVILAGLGSGLCQRTPRSTEATWPASVGDARAPSASATARWRDGLRHRLEALYGTRAPTVVALSLSDKRGLDPELREAFARSGTAHLLAISGFHVGVVAGLLFALLRGGGVERRRSGMVAAAGAWLYVALIGFPDAASRAALILTLVAVSQARGRPPARWGALGSAFLLLLVLDPGRIGSVGFQLSFAGAAGLTAWSRPVRRALSGVGCPAGLAGAMAAGVAATVGTLPIVAWHFERVSLVGIPATLFASPLVALALPGVLLSLGVDFLSHGVATFLAGGVDLVLAVLLGGVRLVASLGWASVWVPRTWVTVAGFGSIGGIAILAGSRVRPSVRRAVGALTAAAAVVFWPVLVTLPGRDTLEMLVIDVGQGDALAIRTPGGHWVVVDTGPDDPDERDPGKNVVVRALRRRGVRRIELLVLTHPDFDHIGGSVALLRSFDVGMVVDPAYPAAKASYIAILDTARARGVPWRKALHGQVIEFDGVSLEVMAPWPAGVGPLEAGESPTNVVSVVLHVRYGSFDALLTGDAPTQVERALAPELHGGIEVLKVGHHGSATATDSLWVARAQPSLALISVGRRNRYGHPAPSVLARLGRARIPVRRTDTEGTLDVLAHSDGTFSVAGERSPGREYGRADAESH